MSYNIDDFKVLSGQLGIRAADVRKLRKEYKDNGPCNETFVDDLFEIIDGEEDPPKVIDIDMNSFRWTGEGSGSTFDYFRENIVPMLRGFADVVIIWEGGDSITGLRIKDGVATEMDVEHRLVPKGGTA